MPVYEYDLVMFIQNASSLSWNELESAVCKMVPILFRPHALKKILKYCDRVVNITYVTESMTPYVLPT